jgi:hypothetical protein
LAHHANFQEGASMNESPPSDRHVVDAGWVRERYGVSKRFVDRRIADGSLKPFKVGTHANRFCQDEVISFMERDRLEVR